MKYKVTEETEIEYKEKWLIPLGMWLVFEIVAVTLWLTKYNLFYLLNFSYIGSAIALGLLLFQLNYRHARRIGFIRYITFTASLVLWEHCFYATWRISSKLCSGHFLLAISCIMPLESFWHLRFGIIGHSVNISAQLPYS